MQCKKCGSTNIIYDTKSKSIFIPRWKNNLFSFLSGLFVFMGLFYINLKEGIVCLIIGLLGFTALKIYKVKYRKKNEKKKIVTAICTNCKHSEQFETEE